MGAGDQHRRTPARLQAVAQQLISVQPTPRKMYAKLALAALVVVSVVATPVPGGHHTKHVKIHVPYKVHTVHHHHVSKVHVPVHVPVVKEVPVYKEVPVIKHVPVEVIKHVHVPVYKKVEVEKLVHVPVPVHHEHHDHHEHQGWEGEALSHGWN
ncbi:unnamed protein product [Plutella xylostella]|uniref:(diamondback moth) hypothetical protein n=1 Tax=Plutella xylostella TaxID=51655 RepID=A0A8S4GGV5_PLUXY|nr:uncharacterized protein DDB_G0272720 [Plutella xylostella]CAG9138128.1 unnamed protein product [Plutella xylostella]